MQGIGCLEGVSNAGEGEAWHDGQGKQGDVQSHQRLPGQHTSYVSIPPKLCLLHAFRPAAIDRQTYNAQSVCMKMYVM